MVELMSPEFQNLAASHMRQNELWTLREGTNTYLPVALPDVLSDGLQIFRTLPQQVALYVTFKGHISSPYKITPNALH
jgi:hypothetical protein